MHHFWHFHMSPRNPCCFDKPVLAFSDTIKYLFYDTGTLNSLLTLLITFLSHIHSLLLLVWGPPSFFWSKFVTENLFKTKKYCTIIWIMLILIVYDYMTYDMPYWHRRYHSFYTMLCIGPHFNCIHDKRRGLHEMPSSGRRAIICTSLV